jgi:hypothetical protein
MRGQHERCVDESFICRFVLSFFYVHSLDAAAFLFQFMPTPIMKIMEVADICCHGRVVSVLEGGYGRTPKRESENLSSSSNTTSSSSLLDKAVFSESVMRHLRALIDPYGMHKNSS